MTSIKTFGFEHTNTSLFRGWSWYQATKVQEMVGGQTFIWQNRCKWHHPLGLKKKKHWLACIYYMFFWCYDATVRNNQVNQLQSQVEMFSWCRHVHSNFHRNFIFRDRQSDNIISPLGSIILQQARVAKEWGAELFNKSSMTRRGREFMDRSLIQPPWWFSSIVENGWNSIYDTNFISNKSATDKLAHNQNEAKTKPSSLWANERFARLQRICPRETPTDLLNKRSLQDFPTRGEK